MSRELLERITASLVVFLITVFSFGAILMFANTIFQWDLFPPVIEKIIYFLGFVTFVAAVASSIINLMLNVSRLTFFIQKIAEKLGYIPGKEVLVPVDIDGTLVGYIFCGVIER